MLNLPRKWWRLKCSNRSAYTINVISLMNSTFSGSFFLNTNSACSISDWASTSCFCLTFTTLRANSAIDNLMIVFLTFFQKTDFDISCKIGNLHEMSVYFLGKLKENISKYSQLKFLPSMLSINAGNHLYKWWSESLFTGDTSNDIHSPGSVVWKVSPHYPLYVQQRYIRISLLSLLLFLRDSHFFPSIPDTLQVSKQ